MLGYFPYNACILLLMHHVLILLIFGKVEHFHTKVKQNNKEIRWKLDIWVLIQALENLLSLPVIYIFYSV